MIRIQYLNIKISSSKSKVINKTLDVFNRYHKYFDAISYICIEYRKSCLHLTVNLYDKECEDIIEYQLLKFNHLETKYNTGISFVKYTSKVNTTYTFKTKLNIFEKTLFEN